MRKLILIATFFFTAPISLLFVVMVLIVLYPHNTSISAANKTVVYAALPATQNILTGDVTESDGRVEKIRQFMAKYHSPLEANAKDIVDAADQYGLDYRLIPAIAMQ